MVRIGEPEPRVYPRGGVDSSTITNGLPTHAWGRLRSHCARLRKLVYPRARGTHCDRYFASVSKYGSPTRAWDTLDPFRLRLPDRRFTHARVGHTFRATRWCVPSGVYPRARGTHSPKRSSCVQSRVYPRTRGTDSSLRGHGETFPQNTGKSTYEPANPRLARTTRPLIHKCLPDFFFCHDQISQRRSRDVHGAVEHGVGRFNTTLHHDVTLEPQRFEHTNR
ncbi:hypothetical protein ACVIGB_001121 [Bradyrhizobium sp. USDA 4341]